MLEFFAEPPPDVHRMWQQLRASSSDTCYRLLASLLNSRSPEAGNALRRNWDAVFPELDALVNSEIDRAELERALWCLDLAGSAPPRSDRLLARLLVPDPAPPVEAWPDHIQVRVALLGQRPVPPPGDYTDTCDMLRFNEVADWQARLVVALLSRELEAARGGERAAAWALWLSQTNLPHDRENPAWIEALVFAVSGPVRQEAAGRVIPVIREDRGWAVPILSLARLFKHLDAIVELDGFHRLLLDLAMDPTTGGDDFGGRLADAVYIQFGPTRPGAIVDTARVLLDAEPTNFPVSEAGAQAPGYFDALDWAFDYLPGDWPGHFQLRLLQRVMPASVNQNGSAELSAGAVQLIKRWCEDPDRTPELARYIADNRLAPLLLGDRRRHGPDSEHRRLGSDIWSPLIKHDPRLRPYGSVSQLRTAAQQVISDPGAVLFRPTKKVFGESGHPEWGKGATILAAAMYEAHLANMEMKEILTVLAAEKSSRDKTLMDVVQPPSFLRVLNELASLIRDSLPDDPRAWTSAAVGKQARLAHSLWVNCLWLIIKDGVLGPDYAQRFRLAYLHRSQYAQDTFADADALFLPPPRRFSLRKRSRPEELYRMLLAKGLPPAPATPRPPGGSPPGVTDRAPDATKPWPDHSRATGAQPVVPPRPGTPPPLGTPPPSPQADPAMAARPARISARVRSWFSGTPSFRNEGAHAADHENKQESSK